MVTQAQGVLPVRPRWAVRAVVAQDWMVFVGPLLAFGCLAVVVLDSPLGISGRVVGIAIALAGGLTAARLASAGPASRALGLVITGSDPTEWSRRVGAFLDRTLLGR